MRPLLRLLALCLLCVPAAGCTQPTTPLRPARVFDGATAQPHEGWVVLVRGERIATVGPAAKVKAPEGSEPREGALRLDAKGQLQLRSYSASSGPVMRPRTCGLRAFTLSITSSSTPSWYAGGRKSRLKMKRPLFSPVHTICRSP